MNATIAESTMTRDSDFGNGKEVSVNRVTVPGIMVISVCFAMLAGGVAIGTYLTSTDARLTRIEADIALIKCSLDLGPGCGPGYQRTASVPAASYRKKR